MPRPRLRPDGRLPKRKGQETLVPTAQPGVVARVKRSRTNRDLAIRLEDEATGRVIEDLGSRRYAGEAHAMGAIGASVPRAGPRGTGRLFFGGMGWGREKRLELEEDLDPEGSRT